MSIRQTHTYVDLPVNRDVYFYLRAELEKAGVLDDYVKGHHPERIVLTGIALVIDTSQDPAHLPACGTQHRGCAPDCPFDAAQEK